MTTALLPVYIMIFGLLYGIFLTLKQRNTIFKYILIVSLIVFSFGCKAEVEQEQVNYGKIFIIVTWSWDVEKVNMNNSTIDKYTVFESDVEYELKKNHESVVSWDSFETQYSGIIGTDNGSREKDTIYSLFISGNEGTLTLEEYR